MRLWTIQPEFVWELLRETGVYRCNPKLSVYLSSHFNFGDGYDWLVKEMIDRIGQPPTNVRYPVWAWHTFDWKRKKPDLRRVEFKGFPVPQVCLEVEIPDDQVLLHDEVAWHCVLNKMPVIEADTIEEGEEKYTYLESLSLEDQTKYIVNSFKKTAAIKKEKISTLLSNWHLMY